MELRTAIGVSPGTVAAFVGGDEKLTLMLALVRELTGAGLRVAVTATAGLRPLMMDTVLVEQLWAIARAEALLEAGQPCLVAGRFLPEGILSGVDEETVLHLANRADVVLVAADGAGAGPAVPEVCNLVVPVAGPEWLAALTPEEAAGRLLDAGGVTRDRPQAARVVPVICGPDTPEFVGAARAAAAALVARGAARVVVAAGDLPIWVPVHGADGTRLGPLDPAASGATDAGPDAAGTEDRVPGAAEAGAERPGTGAPDGAPPAAAQPDGEPAGAGAPDGDRPGAGGADPEPPGAGEPEPEPPPTGAAGGGQPGPRVEVFGPVAGLVLAAGASRRFPGNKLLHPLAGRTLLERSLEAPLGADLREVVVVTGHHREEVEAILRRYPVRVVYNPDHRQGMSTSLRAGLAALFPADPPPGYQPPAAVIIFLGDQPRLTPGAVNRLVAAWREHGAPVVAPVYRDRWRNPVLFAAALVPELMQAGRDEGGRRVVWAHERELFRVPFSDGELFRDVDTVQDLPRPAARH